MDMQTTGRATRMPGKPLNKLPVHRLSALIASGAATAEAVAGACLERIAEREDLIQAWVWIDPDQAIEAARQRDREPSRGPLHGIPIGIKDIIDTEDMPTENGTPVHAGRRPDTDAACVALLREAGAVILGKTRTTELATFQPTVTTNPHDPSRTPGGSSSGSAAAVADAMVPAALGTQTYGSVIRPASFCGVVGLKPSWGTIATAGVKQQAGTLDTVGCFCRTARDLPFLLAGMAGEPPETFGGPPLEAPRIGICRGPAWDGASAETEAAVERAAAAFRNGGALVRELKVPEIFEAAWAVQPEIARYEMFRTFAAERRTGWDRLSDALRAGLEAGRSIPRDRYLEALEITSQARDCLAQAFEGLDALLTAAQTGEAPPGLESTGDPWFNRFWTLAGAPSVALPCSRGPNRLPVGVQLVGPPRQERHLIAAAVWAEALLDPDD